MEWSKIKTIIILLLAMVNLALLALVGYREHEARQYENDLMDGVIQLLEENGIRLAGDALPETRADQVLTLTRDVASEDALARLLLGECQENGSGIRAYTGPRGQVRFHANGDFTLVYAAGQGETADGSPEAHVQGLLAEAGMDCAVMEVQESGARVTVTLNQRWDGWPVQGCAMTAVYESGVLLELNGRRLMGTPAASGREEAQSDATLLVRFLGSLMESGNVCSEITRIRSGYHLLSGVNDAAALRPVWLVETDSGTYQVDVCSGEMERIG